MSSLWQRDRCPLSPLPAPPPPSLRLSYCLAYPVLFHFSVLLLCFFRISFAFCSVLSLFLLLRLTVVRWSDSPRAATIATHLNFIGSPVTLPFRTHTHTLRKQQQWECQKRQTNRAEEGAKTKLLRDANGMAGWLVFWCHIERSEMIPI